ncbi:MAG: heparan-alpha-glucosaminide N-acetyltransferase domain-containing protein [Candidatus Hodarchaeota archaeon]
MPLRRIKSVDTYRGLIMVEMIWVHTVGWAILEAQVWIAGLTISIIDRGMAGPGFLFISGLSAMLFIKNRISKSNNLKAIRLEYFIRALLILVLSLIYNSFVALGVGDPSWIWSWFMLQAISISLFMAWPLLKTPKTFRILIAILFWIMNYFIFNLLLPYKGQINIFGILYHFFYHPITLDPILALFSYFIIGTVIGDIIFEVFQIEDQQKRRLIFKKKLFYPLIIIGGISMILSLILRYPYTLSITSISWIAFAIGIVFLIIGVLLYLEEFEVLKTKKQYKFFYYFSFYSLTVYLSHNILYIFFTHQLQWYFAYIYAAISILIFWVVLIVLFNSRWRNRLSIKIAIGKIAFTIVKRNENKKKNIS